MRARKNVASSMIPPENTVAETLMYPLSINVMRTIYQHQHNTGYVDEGCDRLGVIEDGYLDFAGLEGEDDADQLEEAQVDEDDEVKEKGGGA